MDDTPIEILSILVGLILLALALGMSAHVLLRKTDERSAVGWIGLIWLSPVLGSVLYVLLGINRIRRRARKLRSPREPTAAEARWVSASLPTGSAGLEMLARVVDRFTQGPLLDGNRVMPLIDGDEAFPEMIAAIDAAERSVALASYIFSRDAAGLRFVDALERACQRGVAVRVLVDGIGALYSLRPIRAELARRGIPSARFLFSLVPWRVSFLNLRNHRKLLIVDGRIGFTGGMNLRRHHVMNEAGRAPVKDVHFRIDGPVVAQMMEVFADDWWFTTREDLTGVPWFPTIDSAGSAVARGIAAGPHEEQPKMQWTLFGAVAEARRSVRIVTPYFLPDESLMTALRLAAMGGVEIDIVLPAKNNLPLVAWAAAVRLESLIEAGCRLWLSPPPFDHAKLMVVDGIWSLFGSSNWDPRSLRLNFEFNVEAYDVELAGRLQTIVSERIAAAQPLTREALNRRGLPTALRDGAARLLTPYL